MGQESKIYSRDVYSVLDMIGNVGGLNDGMEKLTTLIYVILGGSSLLINRA